MIIQGKIVCNARSTIAMKWVGCARNGIVKHVRTANEAAVTARPGERDSYSRKLAICSPAYTKALQPQPKLTPIHLPWTKPAVSCIASPISWPIYLNNKYFLISFQQQCELSTPLQLERQSLNALTESRHLTFAAEKFFDICQYFICRQLGAT